ncbi:MAG TPA: GNAT family protein [Chitinophagaceae bacterium]|nr:GNAT family protein [Chitinophagaceae bacterium]
MIIETERLVIRPLKKTDFLDYHNLNSDQRNFEFELSQPCSIDESEIRFNSWLERNLEFDGQIGTTEFCIEDRGEKKLIGVISGLYRDLNSKILEIGISISYDHRNKGYGFEALTAYIAYAFSTVNIHRIFASTDTRNAACIRLLEKLNMTKEGILRKNVLMPDAKYYDEVLYSILFDDLA